MTATLKQRIKEALMGFQGEKEGRREDLLLERTGSCGARTP